MKPRSPATLLAAAALLLLPFVSLRAETPRPEHPRPDAQRENWLNLNGELKAALESGRNTIAVHTRQSAGGQFIDLALLVAP